MIYTQLYPFIDQLGFEILTILFAITMGSVLLGIMTKSFLYE